MKVSEFSYQLPERLIADYPMAQRSASRLLSLNVADGSIEHGKFPDITQFLTAKDLLVFNNTRVIPARLYARKETGGSAEILVERVLGMGKLLAQVRASKSPKPGSRLVLVKSAENEIDSEASLQPTLQVIGRREEFFELELVSEGELGSVLEAYGHMPLPPYIKRQDQALDKDRYQTVYASEAGAVAAPTAGLHFDESLLERLSAIGVSTAFLTLHVGAGTFQPVRAESIDQHRMHSERIELDQSVCDAIAACKARGGRIVAVGTTSVRSLESAASSGVLKPFHGETDIFIYPGYKFQVVDAMITNFHLPESTLLMLVSAFASKRMILDAYEEAIREEYRFFSYGDAMFLHRN